MTVEGFFSINFVYAFLWLWLCWRSLPILLHLHTCPRMRILIYIISGTAALWVIWLFTELYIIHVLLEGATIVGSWIVIDRWRHGKLLEGEDNLRKYE